MAVKGWFENPKFEHEMSRTGLLETFVDFVVEEQSKKDSIPNINIVEKKRRYQKMLRRLRELSLKSLESGQVYHFKRRLAERVFGDDFDTYYSLAEIIQFICPFIDYEDETSFRREKMHRYQHQIFQEFFAAQRLYDLYEFNEKGKLLESLRRLKYMPEIGRFFTEMVEINSENPGVDFSYWQELLMAEATDDYVRTYALQVRDKLGEGKGKDFLDKLVEEENRQLNTADKNLSFIHITGGLFIYGSYEYDDEQPVRLMKPDDFEIAIYPVTNAQYKEFIDRDSYQKKEFWTEEGGKWQEKEKITEPRYWKDQEWNQHDCPVVGVSWYEAVAFCNWLTATRKDGYKYRLPTELDSLKFFMVKPLLVA